MRLLNGIRAMMAAILAVGFLAPAGAVCAAQCVPQTAVVEQGCCHKEEAPSCHKQSGDESKGCTCHFDASPTARPAAPIAQHIDIPVVPVALPPAPEAVPGVPLAIGNVAIIGSDSGPPGTAPPLHRASRAPPVISA